MIVLHRCLSICILFFFFSSRRRHTRSDRDWSSDVCSSDLRLARAECGGGDHGRRAESHRQHSGAYGPGGRRDGGPEIGRASCRGRGEISVGAVSLKKKKKEKGGKGRSNEHIIREERVAEHR